MTEFVDKHPGITVLIIILAAILVNEAIEAVKYFKK